MYGGVRGDKEGGEEKKHFRGLLFFHTAVGSLGVTPNIKNFAKETCFQGAFLLNNGCTMRGAVSHTDARPVNVLWFNLDGGVSSLAVMNVKLGVVHKKGYIRSQKAPRTLSVSELKHLEPMRRAPLLKPAT